MRPPPVSAPERGADTTLETTAKSEAVLAAAGTDLSSVLKTTVYLADMADFQPMNAVYARHFGEHRPARSTVAAAGLPRNVLVEIEVVAVKGER